MDIKKVTVEKTVYVANDGEEFDTAEECSEYEYDSKICMQHKAFAEIENRPEITDYSNFGVNIYNDDNRNYWFRPKTTEELQLIAQAFSIDMDVSDEYVGKWICVEATPFDGFVSFLDDGIAYVKHVLDILGYDVEIKERSSFNGN